MARGRMAELIVDLKIKHKSGGKGHLTYTNKQTLNVK